MHITIRLGEPYWRAAGQRQVKLEIVEGGCLSDALDLLHRRYPKLAGELSEAPPILFVDGIQVDPDAPLGEGSHVHIVWPVAGG